MLMAVGRLARQLGLPVAVLRGYGVSREQTRTDHLRQVVLAQIQVSPALAATTWVLATPIAPWRIRYWVTSSARITLPRVPRSLGSFAARVLEVPVSSAMNRWLVRDATPDLIVFGHKRYVPHPRLNAEDGPIGAYRMVPRVLQDFGRGISCRSRKVWEAVGVCVESLLWSLNSC
ncbi:hypothetical protein ACH4SP_12095 [Streptomyces sp. NPDC021093]|uniref:hypothetical protein n=1 Tax=Streptomyces sp. NPDC021093 TaxID=3365112 RepID=UPI0037ADEC82